MSRLSIILLISGMLLGACSTTSTPTASPTSMPTTTRPTITAIPPTPVVVEASPTTAPQADVEPSPVPVDTRLPATLYVLDRGQIARIERDGTTRTLLTNEVTDLPSVAPIAAFDVGPAGRLAYITPELAFDRLMLISEEGAEPVRIYAESGHELSNLVWSADGEALYLRLLNNREPADLASGIYRLQLADSSLELILPDDTVDDPVNPSPAISSYRPIGLAPDGDRLLVEAFSTFYDGCTPAMLELVGGALIVPQLPANVQAFCGEAAWTPDGQGLMMMAGPTEGRDAGPALWRINTSDGSASPLTATGVFARGPLPLPDGTVRFIQIEPLNDQNGVTIGAIYTLAELTGAGVAPTRLQPSFDDQLNRVLWAPDGSGLIIESVPADGGLTLRWTPLAAGDPLELPITEENIGGLRWEPPILP